MWNQMHTLKTESDASSSDAYVTVFQDREAPKPTKTIFLKRKQQVSVAFYQQQKAQATIWLKCIGKNTEPPNGSFDYSDLEVTLVLVFFCIYEGAWNCIHVFAAAA